MSLTKAETIADSLACDHMCRSYWVFQFDFHIENMRKLSIIILIIAELYFCKALVTIPADGLRDIKTKGFGATSAFYPALM